MAETYALRVQVGSHEYDGEFYLVGNGYGAPADVLDHVAADHLLRIANAPRIEEYLLDVLKHGENTGEAEYKRTDSDVECWIHVDVSYQRYAFGVGDSVFEFSSEPTKSEIASTVTQLQS
ncbi:hypothetical protein [Halorubrum sp. CSM-61]|jgi:hypothetical protein|uniref:hypothetical protein n=1 Tax=Halorubrum sp. CSM-61 TaxID=2485838 RepID=UPI000F4D262E|nr:hypothetical protein [Halorubrum sp. CSM-61]